ncbi:MAG TPA: hypothetical protein EYH05_16240 [Anaerolineae bacterium]|nr:hypothetical protein [Anaerolineae bacterium]
MSTFSRPISLHYLIELFDLSFDLLTDIEKIRQLSLEFLDRSSLIVVKQCGLKFEPQGITLVFILSSSHLVVHTWPENKYLHMDIMRCDLSDNHCDFDLVYENICEIFGTSKVVITPISDCMSKISIKA